MSDLLIEERLQLLSVEESEKQFEAKTEATAEAPTEVSTEEPAEASAEGMTEAQAEKETEEMAEAPTEAMAEKTFESKFEPKTEVNPEAKPESKVEANPETKPEPKAEVQIEPHSEEIPETHSEVLSEAPSDVEHVELAENAQLVTDEIEELHDPIPECSKLPIVTQECSICLDKIKELCSPSTCNHKFCYPCLRNWSKVQLHCPLCKRSLSIIYRIQHIERATDLALFERQTRVNRVIRFQQMITRIIRGSGTYDDYQLFHAIERIYLIPRGISPFYPIDARGQRFRVYTESLWALPVPNVGNGYFSLSTPTVYIQNNMLIRRLYEFILRDVGVIKYIIATYGIRTLYFDPSITNYIMDLVLQFNILDTRMYDLMERFFGSFTAHFFHELYNFACCPSVNIIQYDLHVTFTPEYSYSSGVVANGPVTIRIPVCVNPSIRNGRLPIPNEFLNTSEERENGHPIITLPMVSDLLPEDGPREEGNPTNRPLGLRLRGIFPSRVGSSWYYRPRNIVRASRADSIVFCFVRQSSPNSVQIRVAQPRISEYNNASFRVAPTVASQRRVVPPEDNLPVPELTPQMEIAEIGSSRGILPINDHSSDTSEISGNNDAPITSMPHSSNDEETASAHSDSLTAVANKKKNI